MQQETDAQAKPEQDGVRSARLNIGQTKAAPERVLSEPAAPIPPVPIDAEVAPTRANRSHSKIERRTVTRTTQRRRLATLGLSTSGHLTLADQRKLGARIYRLKSYTTVGKINRKFMQDKQQRLLRNVLALVLLIVVLVIVFVIYNPIQDIVDFRKMLGLDSPFMSIPTAEITEASALPTIP